MGLRSSGHLKRLIGLAAGLGLACLPIVNAWSQDAVVTGVVRARNDRPLPGATVSVRGRFAVTAGTTGTYTLTIPAPLPSGRADTITVRMVGHRPVTRVIQLLPGSQKQDFTLEPDPFHLEDLVVTGVSGETSTKKLPFSVAVIESAELQQVPGVTALAALQGRVAGIDMLQSSGEPGAAPAIQIRGFSSIYPTLQPPLLIIDGAITRMTLSDISGEDIERLEVLKGAAATSYYGSDAANGVIQVFTRRGSRLADGQMVTTARFEGGSSYLTARPQFSMHHYFKLDNAGQFVRALDGSRIADDDMIMDNPYPVYHDPYGQISRHSRFYTASLSMSQRKGKSSFAASLQQTADNGPIVLQDGFVRQNYRINLDHAVTPKVDVSLNMFYGRSRRDGGANADALWDLMMLEPHMDITEPNADGTPYNNRIPDLSSLGGFNPLYDLNQSWYTDNRQRFTGGGRLRWHPAGWLTLEGQYNYDSENSQYSTGWKFGYLLPKGGTWSGNLSRSTASGRNYNTGATATGVWSYGKMTNTTRLAFVYEDQQRTQQGTDARGMLVGGVNSFAGADPAQMSSTSTDYAIKAQDLFAVTTFDIRDRYILDALVRRDGSSLFGEKSRYSTYFRLSGAWRVTEDLRIPGVDELRLRASYGTAGIRPGFDYQYELLVANGGAFKKQSLGNALLKPAHSGELEIGANLAFGGNRYSLEYNFSRKVTRDQMVQQNLPAVSGFTTQWVNAGTLLTRTHELTLGLQPIQHRDLSLTINLTADRTRSVITDWPLPDQRTWFGWYRTGQDLGLMEGLRFVRSIEELYDDPAKQDQSGPGQVWSRDSVLVNELGDVVRRSTWRTPGEKPITYIQCTDPPACTRTTSIVTLGHMDPDFTLSAASTVTWRRLALTGVLYWRQGGVIGNSYREAAFRGSRDVAEDMSGRPLAERKPVSYFADFQRTELEEPGSFLKIRELALNYTFVRRELRVIGLGLLNELRVGLAGRNLFTFTKFSGGDPEVAGFNNPFRARLLYLQYPNPRTVTATVEIAF
jgi:TonB-linked SusC/RagA family outer membrane protein